MKILIVGAGPVGCYIAKLLKLKRQDIEIEIIEEHQRIGRPVHCAGLVSKEVFSESRIPIDTNVVINKIDGAQFFLGKDSFKIHRRDVALVVDREKFDCALGKGLEVNFNTRFLGVEKDGLGYLVETDKGEFYADIVIGADGANSAVRRTLGPREEAQYLGGVQFRMKYNKCTANLVRVYLQSHFFSWMVPEHAGVVRVGIISDNPYRDLLNFIKEYSIKGEIIEKFAGMVPLGKCPTQKDNIFLVGDAACQTKPLTHGGIYYGMRCAEILVDCINNNRTHDYEKLWKNRFAKEIQIGLRVKQFYQQLSHENIAGIFDFFKDNVELLEHFGDFENHSKVISAVLKDRRLHALLGKILVNIIKEIRI